MLPQREIKRRIPQKFDSITPEFDESKFNFNKIRNEEILLETEILDVPVTYVVNDSPVSVPHMLIVPNRLDNLPQVFTENAAIVCIETLKAFGDRYYKIGFNSSGAFSSVNHLHIHLFYLEKTLFVENIVRCPNHPI
jgi:GDP-D-glucose phosphorylase